MADDPILSTDNGQPLYPGRYWQALDDGRIQCDVCPRECRLREGQRGSCFVRGRVNNQMVLTSYGRSSGFCIDPIEKKPLNHFLPGSPVLSFGTAGCNLSCKFCQNWSTSKSRQMDSLAATASPDNIAKAAIQHGCRSVAFTYNDPVIFLEYAVDTAQACREAGVKTVAVSAGYISEAPREEFFRYVDATNIDLKAFSESFYKKVTGSELAPVLDTLLWLKHESNVWFEITTLLIPGYNDSEKEITQQCEWIVDRLGVDVPLHFSGFHPDYRMQDTQATSLSTLIAARNIALKSGIRYVYTGNRVNPATEATYCHSCSATLIGRNRYELSCWGLDHTGRCHQCGSLCAGLFEPKPGNWGRQRQPVNMAALSL